MTDLDTPEALAWAGFKRRGSIRPRYLKDLRPEISEALARCLDPFVHEQAIRPYGAIVCREEPHLEHLGRIIEVDGFPRDVIDSLADGRHAFVLAVTGQPLRLLLLRERITRTRTTRRERSGSTASSSAATSKGWCVS